MPSQLHEGLVALFRDHPRLAPELLVQTLRADVPDYTEVRIDSSDFTDIRPTEYRADVVVQLRRNDSVFGIVVEVQLGKDEDKGFVWPVYIATLRDRIRCPVCLLVIALDDKVANWARQPIMLGGDSRVVPWVLHAANIPQIVDLQQAKAYPELAVLSALAHGRDPDVHKAVEIAIAAQSAAAALDSDHGEMYSDLVAYCLSKAARQVLKAMDPSTYRFQSEFVLDFINRGRAAGRAELALELLSCRFGRQPEATENRIRGASAAQIDALAKRLLTVSTLSEALGELQ